MDLIIRRLKNQAHLLLALFANMLNGFPSKRLTVIGVTGTDGKTTTANLIYRILRAGGIKAAVVSTLGAEIDGAMYETGFHVTTPSPFSVQKYLKIAKNKGCTHAVLEVTSHALDQNRVYGVNFEIGVLTNITHEHLDYHKSYERYVMAKLKLLKNARLSIVNSNGEWFAYVKKIVDGNRLLTYSLHGKEKGDVSLLTLPFKIKTSLIGDFNLENILAAVETARAIGVSVPAIKKAVEDFKPPEGRQEIVSESPLVMVDFAHTPNSFENILPTIRQKTTGRLIHVFGSAGKRDKSKRPKMGKVASYYDDVIILTSEDTRGENISDINSDIKRGISDGKKVHEIEDRRKAIEFAIKNAGREDSVIITGKGHEKSMNLGNGEVPWSDQKIVKEILR